MPWIEENIILTDFLWDNQADLQIITSAGVHRGLKLRTDSTKNRYFLVYEKSGKRHIELYKGPHLGMALWRLEHGEDYT